jgi:hypothetical protein
MRTLAIPALTLALGIVALANLPPSSKNPAVDHEALRAALAPAPKVEDDGTGLVTITVLLGPGEDLKGAYRRAQAAGEAWKRAHPNVPVDYETNLPVRDRFDRIIGAYRHLSYCGVCCPPPQAPPAKIAPPKRP